MLLTTLESAIVYYFTIIGIFLLILKIKTHYYKRPSVVRNLKIKWSKSSIGNSRIGIKKINDYIFDKMCFLLIFATCCMLMIFAQSYVIDTDFNGWGRLKFYQVEWSNRMLIIFLLHIVYGCIWFGACTWSIHFGLKHVLYNKHQIQGLIISEIITPDETDGT